MATSAVLALYATSHAVAVRAEEGIAADPPPAAAVSQVYEAPDASHRMRYVWYAGDHDLSPPMRDEAVAWLRRWLSHPQDAVGGGDGKAGR